MKNFKIDFIDPLFAVAIHIGIVEGLMKEHWLEHEHRGFPNGPEQYANLLLFIAGISTIVGSWVGYHRSIQSREIRSDARFLLDIVLLGLYIFLLLYFRDPLGMATLMASIYVVYIGWDYFKTVEYADEYYGVSSLPERPPLTPNGLTYFWRCIVEWISPSTDTRLLSCAITVGWAAFFLLLVPFAAWPVAGTNYGKIAFAALFILGNQLYRFDKNSRGKVICSGTAKIIMIAAAITALGASLGQLVTLVCPT
jgi:hypothetical protein